MLVGDVYVNGQHVAATDYGYLGFDTDVSQLLRYGEKNEIAVRTDTRCCQIIRDGIRVAGSSVMSVLSSPTTNSISLAIHSISPTCNNR